MHFAGVGVVRFIIQVLSSVLLCFAGFAGMTVVRPPFTTLDDSTLVSSCFAVSGVAFLHTLCSGRAMKPERGTGEALLGGLVGIWHLFCLAGMATCTAFTQNQQVVMFCCAGVSICSFLFVLGLLGQHQSPIATSHSATQPPPQILPNVPYLQPAPRHRPQHRGRPAQDNTTPARPACQPQGHYAPEWSPPAMPPSDRPLPAGYDLHTVNGLGPTTLGPTTTHDESQPGGGLQSRPTQAPTYIMPAPQQNSVGVGNSPLSESPRKREREGEEGEDPAPYPKVKKEEKLHQA